MKTIFRKNGPQRLLAGLFAAALLTGSSITSYAWTGLGHRTIVLIAQNHISDKTKANISAIMQMPADELYTEASWMDKHRRDKEYKFTGKWHSCSMTPEYVYDPSIRMTKGGDCVVGLHIVDYNLSHMKELHLTDSAKVANIRYLIHIVGDMHCLCHTAMQGFHQSKHVMQVKANGDPVHFHAYYDGILSKL